VISDVHGGLKAAISKCFSGASWQRCRAHFARNVLARVPKGDQEMVAAAFRSIFAQSAPDRLAARYDEVTDALEQRLPKAAELLADAEGDVLAPSAFPPAHWRKIWSNNPLAPTLHAAH